mmetsp:Transcript_125714/g.391477  ORF Transcript_125714/g.391477 Transcript_125714/m.391477 type:complete len:233 (-) Transcript_125714:9-707(-)
MQRVRLWDVAGLGEAGWPRQRAARQSERLVPVVEALAAGHLLPGERLWAGIGEAAEGEPAVALRLGEHLLNKLAHLISEGVLAERAAVAARAVLAPELVAFEHVVEAAALDPAAGLLGARGGSGCQLPRPLLRPPPCCTETLDLNPRGCLQRRALEIVDLLHDVLHALRVLRAHPVVGKVQHAAELQVVGDVGDNPGVHLGIGLEEPSQRGHDGKPLPCARRAGRPGRGHRC